MITYGSFIGGVGLNIVFLGNYMINAAFGVVVGLVDILFWFSIPNGLGRFMYFLLSSSSMSVSILKSPKISDSDMSELRKGSSFSK